MRKFNLGDKVAHKANVINWAAGMSVDPKISEIYQVTEKAEGTLFWAAEGTLFWAAVGLHSGAYEKELLHVHEIKEFAIKYLAERMALIAEVDFGGPENADPSK